MKRFVIAALMIVVLPFTMAGECGTSAPTAPKSGVITQITPESVACADAGARTTAVLYQPDGSDKDGAPWPVSMACVTPDAAGQLQVGGRVQA